MKKSPVLGLITAVFILSVQCLPVKPAVKPAANPAKTPAGVSPETGKAAGEEPDRRVTRAFGDAGLPVLKQRIDSPDFSASLMDNSPLSLADFQGKVVFLNFWATWCGPCRAEMPSMEALYQHFKEAGFEMVAVNYRENRKTVNAFTEQFNLTFPISLDPSGRINGLYGVEAFPTTYIIDREGKIVTRVVGSLNWNTPELFAAFEALLES
ncbi:MAG: TlpA family protein disulfide reductase [Spirochaetaceae bacterium]|jgi:thiol-disulfide isomerase/thioredoxin|nr:TlpA family protein disulfide reductase [Spirochaetaceae bacterium]